MDFEKELAEVEARREALLKEIREKRTEYADAAEKAGRSRDSWDQEHIDIETRMVADVEALDKQLVNLTKLAALNSASSKMEDAAKDAEKEGASAVETRALGESSFSGLYNANEPGDGNGGDPYVDLAKWLSTGQYRNQGYTESIPFVMPAIEPDTEKRKAFETRALSTTGAALGETTVPDEIIDDLVVALYTGDPIRQAGATVRATPDGVTRQVPTMERNATDVPIVAEGANAAALDPVLGATNIPAYVYRNFVDVSQELIDDNGVGLMQELGPFLADKVFGDRGKDHTSGSGTNEPRGIVTAMGTTAGDSLDILVGATPTADAVIALSDKVNARYAANAVWMCNRTTLSLIEKLQSNTGAGAALRVTYQGADTFIRGQRVVVNSNMGDPTGTNTNTTYLLYGNFSYYRIRDVRVATAAREARPGAYSTRLHIIGRGGGNYVNPGNDPVRALRRST